MEEYFYCLALATLILGWIVGFSAVISGIVLIGDFASRKTEGPNAAWFLVGGIASLTIGLIILFSTAAQVLTTLIILITVGIWIIITGIVRIVHSFQLRKANKELPEGQKKKSWIWLLIFGILVLLLGIFALTNIRVLVIAVGILVGIEVIFAGVNALVSGFILSKKSVQ